ncbi:MAG TPA: hypothetical protein G4O11_08745 [Anaerolineae bacterium]|nr:hypothetical protein [Anaerolineae bacterium]
MKKRQNLTRATGYSLLMILSLVVATLSCAPLEIPGPSPTPDLEQATMAALAATQSHLSDYISYLATSDADHATQIARQMEITSFLATRIPPRIVTPLLPTLTPYRPVHGSVVIEGGNCCVGGIAGETIEIVVTFEASSPMADVTEMRVRLGSFHFTEDDMAHAEWEEFVPYKTYSIQVALNWVGFYITVQYRDELGNLSPIYRDDISVEGHPPTTIVHPTP